MNQYGEQGWDVSFQLIERHRMLFFGVEKQLLSPFLE